MIFDEDTMTRIHYEIKTETRRLYNPNRRPAIPGHTHKIKLIVHLIHGGKSRS